MNLSIKNLRAIIVEELQNILSESGGGGLQIRDIVNAEEGDSWGYMPLVYDGELIEIYEDTDAEYVLKNVFKELDDTTVSKVLTISGDSLNDLFTNSQAITILQTLDNNFQGYAKGQLILDKMYGETGIIISFYSGGIKIVEGENNIDSNGEIKLSLGYGVKPNFSYDSFMNPDSRHYDEYFGETNTGSGGYGNQDIEGSVSVKILKLIDDLNNGRFSLSVENEDENPSFLVVSRIE